MKPEFVIPVAAFSMLLVVALLALRNVVTCRLLMTANNTLHGFLLREIDAGRAGEAKIADLYDRLDALSYDAVLWNPLIWTARQAYPWLYDLVDARSAA